MLPLLLFKTCFNRPPCMAMLSSLHSSVVNIVKVVELFVHILSSIIKKTWDLVLVYAGDGIQSFVYAGKYSTMAPYLLLEVWFLTVMLILMAPSERMKSFRDLGPCSLLPSEYVISTLCSHPQESDSHKSSSVTPKPSDAYGHVRVGAITSSLGLRDLSQQYFGREGMWPEPSLIP